MLSVDIPQTNPIVQPLPYHLDTSACTDPLGSTFTVDSVSFLQNGHPWYGIVGEIHFARLPVSIWREGLLRMKAGGLNMVSVYVSTPAAVLFSTISKYSTVFTLIDHSKTITNCPPRPNR
jgi:hypothetical protein